MSSLSDRIAFAAALSDPAGFSVPDLVLRFASDLDAGTRDLLDRMASSHDLLFIALRQLPVKLLLNLACDFANHTLNSTRENRKYDWQQSEGNRNESTLAYVRAQLALALDDPHTLFKLSTAAASAPAGNPGIFLIAKATGDPQNAARHIYHLAKEARQYFAFHSTEYPHHTNMMRAAEQQELKWQLEHLHRCVADARVSSPQVAQREG